jgi:hypothetical protein
MTSLLRHINVSRTTYCTWYSLVGDQNTSFLSTINSKLLRLYDCGTPLLGDRGEGGGGGGTVV